MRRWLIGLAFALTASAGAVAAQPADVEAEAPVAEPGSEDAAPDTDAPTAPDSDAPAADPPLDETPAEAPADPPLDLPAGEDTGDDLPEYGELEALPEEAPIPPTAREALEDEDDDQGSDHRVRYYLESIHVRGNTRTNSAVIKRYVPLEIGEAFDPEERDLETVQFHLMSTGWFDSVNIRLRRGAERGWVVMVVEVVERNTIVVEQVAIGVSEGVNNSRSSGTRLNPYVGLSIADTNLLGRGFRLSFAGLASEQHQGVRVAFTEPHLFGGAYALTIAPFFNNSRQYFGLNPLVSTRCGPDAPDACLDEVRARNAVVFYRRGGFRVGTGRLLGGSTSLSLSWQGEFVRVLSRPEVASELRGSEVHPIDFSINPGRSFVSVIRVGLIYDRRDDPGLPTRGTHLRVLADAGTRLIGSDYEFLRLQARFRQWVPLPVDGHTLRFGAFAGIVFGEAPFFYKFHASDLSDFTPSRVLEMELDRRPPRNLLGTSVIFMRNEEFAARFDVEYGIQLMRRRRRGLRGVQLYFGAGLYALADIRSLRLPISGFEGAARLPVDITFDVGFRADTNVGVFQFGFSNLLGFISP